MNDMPHDMRAADLLERQRMLDLIGLLAAVAATGRTEGELTTTERSALAALATDAYDRPANCAQNLLCFLYGQCRAPLTGGGEGSQRSLIFTYGDGALITPSLLVHPNPASSWAAITYDLAAPSDQAWITLRDITGREMDRLVVRDRQGQLVWDVRGRQPGAYSVELINNGSVLTTQKLIVQP